MRTKKQHIHEAALKLFTDKGVRATSTKAISEEAGVSEALIFRYYSTKQDLVEEIIKQGYKDAAKATLGILNEKDDLKYILKTIEMPLHLVSSNPDFWKMQYNIIALNETSRKYHQLFIRPCEVRLNEAFSNLKYPNPLQEAALLLLFIDGLWKHFAGKIISPQDVQSLIDLLQKKYSR